MFLREEVPEGGDRGSDRWSEPRVWRRPVGPQQWVRGGGGGIRSVRAWAGSGGGTRGPGGTGPCRPL